MKNYMAEIRAKRGTTKRPISTHKEVSKEHIQNIVNEALEKYFLVSTPVVEVPEKLVTINKNGKAKLIDTLTKAGNLKKVDGENVIKLEAGDNLVVKTEGNKYNADEILKTIPSQTIVHKTVQKTQRPQIKATTKDYNDDVFEMENENIPIQKILHNPQNKTIRRAKQEPYTYFNEVIEPEIKTQKKKEVAKREKVTTKKESPKIIESDKSIKITNHNEDKNSPYSEVWKWPDEYFNRRGENPQLMSKYTKTKDKTIIKKIKENIKFIKEQQKLYIEHLNKLLKRGAPDVTQDKIDKQKMLNNKEDEYYKKKLEDFEK